MATYLEFEDKIKKIEDEIITAKTKLDEHAVEILEKKLEKEVEKTFKNLSDYRVMVSGSPAMVYGTFDALVAAGMQPEQMQADVFAYAPRPA